MRTNARLPFQVRLMWDGVEVESVVTNRPLPGNTSEPDLAPHVLDYLARTYSRYQPLVVCYVGDLTRFQNFKKTWNCEMGKKSKSWEIDLRNAAVSAADFRYDKIMIAIEQSIAEYSISVQKL